MPVSALFKSVQPSIHFPATIQLRFDQKRALHSEVLITTQNSKKRSFLCVSPPEISSRKHKKTLCCGMANQQNYLVDFSKATFGFTITSTFKHMRLGVFSAQKNNYFHFDCSRTCTNGKKRCIRCQTLYSYVRRKYYAVLNQIETTIPSFLIKDSSHYQNRTKELETSFNHLLQELNQLKLLHQHKEQTSKTILKDPIFKYLERIWKEYPDFNNSFIYKFFSQQLKALLASYRGTRWDKDIIEFAKSIRFLGGAAVINFMRGQQHRGQGKNIQSKRSLHQFALFLPPVSTIQRHLIPVAPYIGVHLSRIQHIIEKAAILDKKLLGGIISDEIEIMKGLIYTSSKKAVYGLEKGPITVDNVDHYLSLDNEMVQEELASKVLMTFFVSLDGTMSVPLGCFPTTSITAVKYEVILETIMNHFKDSNVEIVFGATDGWDIHNKFVSSFKQNHPNYHHIFDYVHLVKNGRNFLLKNMITHSNISFSIRDLFDYIWDNQNDHDHKILLENLTLEDLRPVDKMALKHVLALIKKWKNQNSSLISILLARKESSLIALGTYLSNLKKYYQVFRNFTNRNECLKDLLGCYNYFNSCSGVSDAFKSHIYVTYRSLQELLKYPELARLSHVGTDLVENYFSLVRHKVLYPNLWDFYCIETTAYGELIKRYSKDGSFLPWLKKSHSKCYGNLPRGYFSIHDIPVAEKLKTLFPRKLQTNLKSTMLETAQIGPKESESVESAVEVDDTMEINESISTSNIETEMTAEQIVKLKLIAFRYKCSRKVLTIRQATTKTDPTIKQAKNGYIHCRFPSCIKTYVYQKALLKHCLTVHQMTEDLFQKMVENEPNWSSLPDGEKQLITNQMMASELDSQGFDAASLELSNCSNSQLQTSSNGNKVASISREVLHPMFQAFTQKEDAHLMEFCRSTLETKKRISWAKVPLALRANRTEAECIERWKILRTTFQ